MAKTLAEIAQAIQGEIIGDATCRITGIAGIKEAQEGDITFLGNSKYLPLLKTTKASAVIVSPDISSDHNMIQVDNPTLAFSQVIELFHAKAMFHPQGIHASAVIADTAHIGNNVSVGAYAVIDDGAIIGDNSIIYPHVHIGAQVSIGKNCVIHSNTVIGSDGFGYVTMDDKHIKVPQVGTVIIEDDVEIGANVTIDRARFDKTMIGQGTKIDNLVQIAHNVVIGKNCIIVSHVGISGSTVVGDNVIIAGQVGVAGHLTIGDNAVIMAQSGVSKSIESNQVMFGTPAKPHKQALKMNAHIQRLDEYANKIKELQKRVDELEGRA